jgi:two-component system, chemotaxis family, protein-glutamate methylesterase/glutaminase
MATSEQGREHEQRHEREHESARIRVLIVDDSALMRRLLADLLGSAPELEVVGTARDGREAVLQAVRLKPNVITLDVEMPEVSGLDALPTLLAVQDAPVIMVSALTQEGADVTLRALELGAVDFLPKPERNQLTEIRANRELLIGKVLAAALSRVRRRRRTPPSESKPCAAALSSSAPSTAVRTASSALERPRYAPTSPKAAPATTQSSLCIVIGISTGGPQALAQTFPLLAPPMPPVVVVQHMPAQFTAVFAERLNRYSALTIEQAKDGDLVVPDRVLIAPGGLHLMLTGHPPRVRIALSDDPPVSGHRPSIDVLFSSAAKAYESSVVGLIMTGMGRDGVDGCKAILSAGGYTFGQDEATSVVYGMNKAALLEGAVKTQFALDELPDILRNIAALRTTPESPPPSSS